MNLHTIGDLKQMKRDLEALVALVQALTKQLDEHAERVKALEDAQPRKRHDRTATRAT